MGSTISKTLNATIFKDELAELPKKINIIWLGSPIQDTHIPRIKKWKKINPSHTLYIWIEERFLEEIQQQLDSCECVIKTVESLRIDPQIRSWISKFTSARRDKLPANYAAASDAYRFLILIENGGGWYFDTDIIPFIIGNRQLALKSGFLINAERDLFFKITSLAPDVIATLPNSLLLRYAYFYYESLALGCNKEAISLIRSNIALIRRLATETSTGAGVNNIIPTMRIDGRRICDNQLNIVNRELFCSIAQKTPNHREQSWIFDHKNDCLQPGLITTSQFQLINNPNSFEVIEALRAAILATNAARRRTYEIISLEHLGYVFKQYESILPNTNRNGFFSHSSSKAQLSLLLLLMLTVWLTMQKLSSLEEEAVDNLQASPSI